MKTRNLLWFILLLMIFESCRPAISAYEAANNPKGRKCRRIK